MTKLCIVGLGNIGSEVYKRVKKMGMEVPFIVEYDGIYSGVKESRGILKSNNKIDENQAYTDYFKKVDAILLSIPTFDNGSSAYNFIKTAIGMKKPIVTSEKGALSNFFPELEENLNLIGYSATVGGGSRLLRYMQERINPNLREMHAIVNGTLNYIFDEVSNGRSAGEVVEETKRLGYAEPGAENLLDVINKEANSDVPMKVSILFNIFNYQQQDEKQDYIRAKDISCKDLTKEELKKLVREASMRRYIVSITKNGNENDVINGFEHSVNGWSISAGFKNIDQNPVFKRLVTHGVNNALLLYEGEYGEFGIYKISGPGAGPKPTANSMIIDLQQLLKNN